MTSEIAEAPRPGKGLLGVSLFALIGLAANIYLTSHFYAVRNGTAGFKSACNLGAAMNCDVVAASPYAELVGGLPVSSFGAGWFLALFILSIAIRMSDSRREGERQLLWLGGFGMLFSLAYVAIMMFVIKTLCLFCLGVDVASAGVLLSAFSLKPPSLAELPFDLRKWQSPLITLGISTVVALVLLHSLDEGNIPRNQIDERVDSVMTSPVLAVGAGEENGAIGPVGAPITIVEFSDFQCPFCRIGAFNLNTVVSRYAGKIRIVFRHYPLDSTCNKSMEHSLHQYACEAAKVAWCANQQGKFQAVYEAFFEHQTEFSGSDSGRPENIAKAAGADLTAIQSCVTAGSPNMAIARDIEDGKTLGVQSTPTFFINGHKVEGAYPVPVWTAIIDRLLAGAK